MASTTRDQFDESNGVVKKIFQKGKHLADADLNEQGSINDQHHRRLLSSIVAHVDKRFGDGFKVEQNANPLTVTVKAGFAAFHTDTNLAVLLKLDSDYVLSGFSTWTEDRTDYVYVDIHEREVGPVDDPDIVNPDVGEETCRDIRISYTIAISEGAAPSSPPTDHTYLTIATITKSVGTYIAASDILVSLINQHAGTPTFPETPIWTHSSESHTSADAPLLSASSERYIVTSSSGETAKNVVRFSFRYQSSVRYLALYCRVIRDDASVSGYLRLDSFPYGGQQILVPKVSTDVVAYCPATDAVEGTLYEVTIQLRVEGTGVNVYMERPVVVMGFGEYEVQIYSESGVQGQQQ
jgi:hypothetical protein